MSSVFAQAFPDSTGVCMQAQLDSNAMQLGQTRHCLAVQHYCLLAPACTPQCYECAAWKTHPFAFVRPNKRMC